MSEVLMLTRAPRLGEVKSRLAREIGEDRALAIHRKLGSLVAAAVSREFRLTVVFTPSDAGMEMRSWLGDHEYEPQVEGSLGERLACATRSALERAAGPVIVIGSDAPQVDAAVIRRAEEELQSVPVVLGPALDGGYYLVGLSMPLPDLFRNIAWGTGRVLRQTTRHLDDLGQPYRLLETLRDVDTREDLVQLGLEALDG